MKIRRIALISLAATIFLLTCLCACGNFLPQQDIGMHIVCLSFPEYDWAKNIIGENPAEIRLELLVDSGVDMHSYQATVDDITHITNCDLLIYTGGISEQWVSDAVSAGRDPDLPVIEMLQLDNMRLYSAQPSLNDHAHDGMHEHEHADFDEHFWLSLRNAETACKVISDAICRLDPENAPLYQNNLDRYLNELRALDESFFSALSSAPLQTILVADRFPFRYLTEDYGLESYAAFSGCSSETDASFETIVFLADKLHEMNLPAVIITENASEEIAAAVIQNSGHPNTKTLTLDSMQSVTRERMESGENYISIMQRNLDTLTQALNCAQ